MTESNKKSRNEQLALYHARLIQEQKDIEAQNLQAIEKLIELPSSATEDCRSPSTEDEDSVREAMKLFAKADFDSVVEERNINDRCGYVLCPKAKPSHKAKSKFRILRNSASKLPQVVEAADLEKWCSEECIKRALYLRVQLSDVPVWERAGMPATDLQLYGDSARTNRKQQEEVRALTAGLRQLALERGDQDHELPRSGTIEVEVREKG